MEKFIERALVVASVLVVLATSPAYGQNNDRWRQEQAAANARQAQAQAQAARDAQRARDDAAREAQQRARQTANDNARSARDRQTATSGNARGSSSYPPPPPTSRLTFAPRQGAGAAPTTPTFNRAASTSQNFGRAVPPGTKFSSSGVSNVLTKPTPPMEKKGFTGRFTADGRALVKVQGRVYAVPASRIGVRPPLADANQNSVSANWSAQKQRTLTADIQRLVAGTPGTVAPASMQLTARSRTNLGKAVRTIGRLSPGRDNSVFWSGHAVNDDRIRAAATWARNNGGKTLEAVLDEGGLKLPKYNPGDPSSGAAWEIASEEFAKSASGKVRVLAVGSPYAGSVWARVEFPALKMNQDVTEIWSVDPRTGTEEMLWKR